MTGSRQILLSDINNLLLEIPGYLVGNWYLPMGPQGISVGGAPGINSIRLFPAYIKELCTINTLGVRVTTLSVSGNVQAAIYTNNPATSRPTGVALASTASMSTTTATSVNASVNIQVGPGLYWFATNSDNGTSVLASIISTSANASALIGSATQGSSLGTASILGVTVPQTFGTWPDLTSASFTELVGTTSMPLVQFKIASVP